MKWVLIIFSLISLIVSSAMADTNYPVEVKPQEIKETYKIKGSIQYNDNEVETIYLDDTIEKPHINIPKKTLNLPVNILNITSNNNTYRSALARAMTNGKPLGDILPLSVSVSDNFNGFSYGQTWAQELSYSQMEDTTSFFIRYDAQKYFSIAASIRQSVSQDIGTQFNTLRITPEWHINDRLTIKDSFSSYMNLPKDKNEITIVYTPMLSKYADALKFELAVAQSYYRTGKQSSAISFSTAFQL